MLLSIWLSQRRGRGAALARYLDVPPSMVTKMADGTKRVPLERCPAIQAFTANQVTCEELRPDQVEHFALIRQQSGLPAMPPPPRPLEPTAGTHLGHAVPTGAHPNNDGHSAPPSASPAQDTKSGNESGRRVDINKRRHRWDE